MGDVLRRACLARYGRRFSGAPSATLAGKNKEGNPLGGHGHAHYLSLDQDGDGLLDHLVLWAPSGLATGEVQALADLERLLGFGHVPDFRPARLGLEAMGDIAQVAPELVGPSKRWRTFTPFAPARHAKRRTAWNEHIAEQIRTELSWRGFPPPAGVRVVVGDSLAYRRHRPTTERLEHARRASAVEMEFDEPVPGPVSLGALSHFGLGLFLPA